MCRLWNIAMHDYQEGVTTGQTDGQTDAGQSDSYVPLCFSCATKKRNKIYFCVSVSEIIRENEAVKMIRLKEGFVRMAEAYIELGKKCSTIFQAQKVGV